jgi:hypothetical protein
MTAVAVVAADVAAAGVACFAIGGGVPFAVAIVLVASAGVGGVVFVTS